MSSVKPEAPALLACLSASATALPLTGPQLVGLLSHTPDYGPLEAGLMFTCKLKSDIDFLGREAVEKSKQEGPRRRLVSFVVEGDEPMLWGGELVLRDGVASGQVMSAAWGETLGSCVGLAYVWHPDGSVVGVTLASRRSSSPGGPSGRRRISSLTVTASRASHVAAALRLAP